MPRPRKSDAVKKAAGTLQPCRSSKRIARSTEKVGSLYEITTQPPVGLTKEAREAWNLAVQCAPKGLLLATDMSVLERWARNYALYRRLSRDVEKDGVVIHWQDDAGDHCMTNPAFNAQIKVQQQLVACEKELGFTPSSRARVRVEPDEEENNEFSDF